MADEKYYTTDTNSVAREIDVSNVATGGDEGDGEWSFEWKRPLGYLVFVVLLVLSVLYAAQWLGLLPTLFP